MPKRGIDGQIEDLDRRIQELGAYIDQQRDDLGTGDWLKLLDLHSTLIGRVTRVRQTRQRLGGGDGTALSAAIHKALDAISKQWGIEL
jgi:hypothetical protein